MRGFLSRNAVEFEHVVVGDDVGLAEFLRDRAGVKVPVTRIGDEEIEGPQLERIAALLGLKPQSSARQAAGAPKPVVGATLAVATYRDDTVTFAGPGGSTAVGVGRHPFTVVRSASGCTLAAVAHGDGTVTFLDARDGTERARLVSGAQPAAAVAHPERSLLYVTHLGDRHLTLFDPDAAQRLSQVELPDPYHLQLDVAGDVLYVADRRWETVLALSASTLEPLRARPLPAAGFELALSHDAGVLYRVSPPLAPGRLFLYETATGRRIAEHTTADMPFYAAAHPRKPLVYVSCLSSRTLEIRDGHSGDLLGAASVGRGARALTVGPDDTMHVSCYDDDVVLALDDETGDQRARLPTGRGPLGAATFD